MTRKIYPTETLRLGNAALRVEIALPSGRCTLIDRVTGGQWIMDASQTACGLIACGEGDTVSGFYRLGDTGERGALFTKTGEFVRCGRDDDFDSIGIEAQLDPLDANQELGTTVRIEFLVSRAFPTVDFHMNVQGPVCDSIQYIAYPLGFQVDRAHGGQLVLPPYSAIASATDCRAVADQFPEWSPSTGRSVRGLNLFAATQSAESGRRSAIIGYLDSQYSELETRCDPHTASVTPILHNPAVALREWRDPYRVRYTLVPDATDEAIAFHFLEQLQTHFT